MESDSKKLDGMCQDCPHLDKHCAGSYSGFYSGCVWKNADAATVESFGNSIDDAIRKGAGK